MELLLFLFAIAVVAVIGHLIWLAVAAVIRAIVLPDPRRGPQKRTPHEEDEWCVGCGTRLSEWDRDCPSCGLERAGKRARAIRELDGAARQIRALVAREEMDQETATRVENLLLARRQTLLARAASQGELALPTPQSGMTPTPLPPPTTPLDAAVLDVLPVDPQPHAPAPVRLAEDRPTPTAALVVEAPVAPRRSFARVLSSFMEERNILWGELVGGLLIVGCSIALVLSLWRNLQTLPYFPVAAFATLTLSLFAGGLYTLHHWKLATTSRGLLLIAMLLVPLNLLLLSEPSARGEVPIPPLVNVLVALAAVTLFSFVVRASARDLIGIDFLPGPLDRRWLLMLALIGTAGSQLFAPVVLGETPLAGWTTSWLVLASIGVACHLAACGAVLGGLTIYGGRESRLTRETADALFVFLGLATFAILSVFVFLLTRLADPSGGFTVLASPLVLAGIPPVVLGLLVVHRLGEDQPARLRVAGTAVALAGLCVMLGGIGLAWPASVPLIVTLTLSGVVLTVAAFASRVPWAHAGGVPALALALLIGFHLVAGHLPGEDGVTLLRQLTSADSGAILAGVMVTLAAVAHRLTNAEREAQGRALGWASLGVGLASLLLVTGHGDASPWTAAVVHGLCALTAAFACHLRGSVQLGRMAGVLFVVGSLWALHAGCPGQLAWWGVTLAAESLALVLLARRDPWIVIARQTPLFAGALGGLLALLAGNFPSHQAHVLTALLLSLTMLARALRPISPGWFAGFQAGAIVTVLCLVTTLGIPRGWFDDPRGLQAHGIGLGLLCLVLGVARLLAPGEIWHGLRPGLDRVTLGALVTIQVLLALVAVQSGIVAEWGLSGPLVSISEPTHVHGPGGWLMLLVVTTALLPLLAGPPRAENETRRVAGIVGLILSGFTLTLLVASLQGENLATASALRWGLAAYFLVGSALIWQRETTEALLTRLGGSAGPAHGISHLLFTCVAGFVVLLTAVLTARGFAGISLPGPLADSLFARMGSVASSITPLLIVIVGLVGTSVRERWPGFALAAGLLFATSAMGGHALAVVKREGGLDGADVVFTALLGCQTSALAGLAWLLFRRRIGGGVLLGLQVWLGLVGALVVALCLAPDLVLGSRAIDGSLHRILGEGPGWLALLLSAGGALWFCRLESPRQQLHVVGLAVLLAGILAASHARAWDTVTFWVSYHVLAGFWSLMALVAIILGSLMPASFWESNERLSMRSLRGWLVCLAFASTFLGVRTSFGTPGIFEALPPGTVLTASILMGAVALWFRLGGYAHASGWLFTLAVFLGWCVLGRGGWATGWLLVALGLAVSASFWWTIELPWLRIGTTRLRWGFVGHAPLATLLSLLMLVVVVLLLVLFLTVGERFQPLGVAGWAAASAIGLALGLATWARYSLLGMRGLYVLGLCLIGLGLHALSPTPVQMGWLSPLALASHALLASLAVLLWQRLAPPSEIAGSPLTVPLIPERQWNWLQPAQGVVALLVILLGFFAAIRQPGLVERLTGSAAILLLIPAALTLTRVLSAAGAESMRLCGLALGVLALSALAWAFPAPHGHIVWLERNVWLLVALTAAGAAGLESFPAWPAGRRLSLVVVSIALMLSLAVLGQMFPVFDKISRRTPLNSLAILAVALALVGQIVIVLRLALRGDPLDSSESARTGYVYLAEVLLVVLFLHVRLNVPELFLGALARYWTFVVVTLAFVGVGLGEWFERRQLRVLAVPLSRTGLFLPLVPLLVFWARPPEALLSFADSHAPGLRPLLDYVHRLPWNFQTHALIWFLASGLYALMALARQSYRWTLVAALAANFGLWALLAHADISFVTHPQAWVIPLALIVLVSEHLHRGQLDPGTSQGLRYLGISMIYVASTADLFLVGIGKSVWLPIILAAVCVAGVLAGILLRVRAFLFLGVGFLLVDILSMIWLAAVQHAQTWLWWASGIVLGVAILTLFAVFEKRRNDILHLVEHLKQWD